MKDNVLSLWAYLSYLIFDEKIKEVYIADWDIIQEFVRAVKLTVGMV